MGGRPVRGLSKMPSPMKTVLMSQPNTELMVVSEIACCRSSQSCKRNTSVVHGAWQVESVASSNAFVLASFLRSLRIFF